MHASSTVVSGRRILRTVSVFDESIIISSSLMVVSAAAFPLYKASVHFNAISSPSAKINVVLSGTCQDVLFCNRIKILSLLQQIIT